MSEFRKRKPPSFENNPFDIFDKIFVINLDAHLDRWVRFYEQANDMDFAHKLERIPGVSNEIGSFGCAMSHKNALELARNRGYSSILLFEDDAVFLYDKAYVWKCLRQARPALKKEGWDLFYLGINPAVALDNIPGLARDASVTGRVIKPGDLITPKIPFYGCFGIGMNRTMFGIYDKTSTDITKFTPEVRGDMIIQTLNCKKLMIWPALVSVTDAPTTTGVGLDKKGSYRNKYNDIKIVRAYDKLGFTDNNYVPTVKPVSVPDLFTIWISDRNTLPDLQVMCLKSMVLTNHTVKLYSYTTYANVPEGVEVVDLERIWPRSKCLKNRDVLRHTRTTVPDTYCMMADLIRIKILAATDSIWVDSDIFVLQNIKPFLKKEMIPGELSNWAKGLSICNGLLRLDGKGPIMTTLLGMILDYENGRGVYADQGCLVGAATMQTEILPKHPAEVAAAYLSHLCIVPISKKHQETLYDAPDIPQAIRPEIFGIHLWNSGYLDTRFNTLRRSPGCVMDLLVKAVQPGNNFNAIIDNLFVNECSVKQYNKYSIGDKYPQIFYDRGLKPRGGKVSVITTAFNTADYIEEALEGIYSQTWFKNHDFEVLIGVDSCPRTLIELSRILHRYANLKVYYNKVNSGTYVTRNMLMSKAVGDYFVFVDSDDIAKPDLVETVINSGGELTRFRIESFSTDKSKLTMFPCPAYGAFGITRDAMAKLGGFIAWPCSGDAELLSRARGNVDIKVINRSLYLYRKHGNSLTANNTTGMHTEARKQYNARIQARPSVIKYTNPVVSDAFMINIEYRKLAATLHDKCSGTELQMLIQAFNNY